MRWLVVVLVAAGCTRHNPAVCCTTPELCDRLGLDMMYECEGEQVCTADGACIEPQCTTSADCTSPDTPFCINKICVGACQSNADCAFAPDTVCDVQSGLCRACLKDSECDSGVCLGADQKCVSAARVVFIRSDGVDTGTCTESAPCQSFLFALSQLTSSRDVIHIMGASYSVGDSAVDIPFDNVFIDGDDTMVTRATEGSVFQSTSSGRALRLTLSDMVIGGIGTAPAGAVSVRSGVFSLTNVTLQAGGASTNDFAVGSRLVIERSVLAGLQPAYCLQGGELEIRRSTLHVGALVNDCRFTLAQSSYDGRGVAVVEQSASFIVIENNLFVANASDATAISTTGAAGSFIRFNTFVNRAPAMSPPITCAQGVMVSSNIFAWNSSMAPSCSTRYSLFDSIAPSGEGNLTGDASTFFVGASDFHLAAASPARAAGEPGLDVNVDIDGDQRPSPSDTNPDIGADESP